MLPIANAAFTVTVGLLITFVGIGVVVNAIILYIVAVAYGEHEENYELLYRNNA